MIHVPESRKTRGNTAMNLEASGLLAAFGKSLTSKGVVDALACLNCDSEWLAKEIVRFYKNADVSERMRAKLMKLIVQIMKQAEGDTVTVQYGNMADAELEKVAKGIQAQIEKQTGKKFDLEAVRRG